MTRAAAGEVATARTMRQNPGPLLKHLGGPGRALGERFPVLFLRKRHVLLKLVYANLNLAWLSANLPDARQVCVLRHPCGQFDSWQRLGWEPRPARLLENRRLVADHLAPFVELIRSAEISGSGPARSGPPRCTSSPPDAGRRRQDHRRLRVALRRSGGALRGPLRPLARPGPAAERFIRGSDGEDDGRTYSMTRPTAKQIDKWKERLSPRTSKPAAASWSRSGCRTTPTSSPTSRHRREAPVIPALGPLNGARARMISGEAAAAETSAPRRRDLAARRRAAREPARQLRSSVHRQPPLTHQLFGLASTGSTPAGRAARRGSGVAALEQRAAGR